MGPDAGLKSGWSLMCDYRCLDVESKSGQSEKDSDRRLDSRAESGWGLMCGDRRLDPGPKSGQNLKYSDSPPDPAPHPGFSNPNNGHKKTALQCSAVFM